MTPFIVIMIILAIVPEKEPTSMPHLAPIQKTTRTTLRETLNYLRENGCYTDARRIIVKGQGYGRGRTIDRPAYEYRVDQQQYDYAYKNLFYKEVKITKDGYSFIKLTDLKTGITYHCRKGEYNIVTPVVFLEFLFGKLEPLELRELRKIAIDKPLNHYIQTEEL